MGAVIEKSDGTIYTLMSVANRQPRLVVHCFGSAQKHHQKELAKALRGEDRPSEDVKARLKWLAEHIGSGLAVEILELQSAIARSEIDFFMDYWCGQFPGLEYYPINVKAPNILGDAGRRALENTRD